LQTLAKAYAGQMIVAKVNTDENPEWATRYRVRAVPTLLFMAEGEVILEQVGVAPKHVLQRRVDEFLELTAKPPAPVGARILSPFMRDPCPTTRTHTPREASRSQIQCRLVLCQGS
jgi:thioredoxin-like negative regulator of GroEL